MAFSDLCHIGNAYKTVENDTDQSERIMEENSIVRDLITKILDESGPTEGGSSIQPPEKAISSIQSPYPKNDTGNTSYIPPSYNNYQNSYNYSQNDQNGFNFSMPNGYNTNGFVNYPEGDVTALLGMDQVSDADAVTPEQLNLLRLAAQEIGGAQFTSPNKFDDKFYNYFEPNQRNSLPETNMFNVNNFSRPNSLNLDANFANYDFNQRLPYKEQSQDPAEILAYLSQLNISLDRNRDENAINNMDFKMPMDLNYQTDFNKMNDENKMFYRNYPKFENFYESMPMSERSPIGQNQSYEFPNQQPNAVYKPNGFQNEFMRRDMNMMPREGYQPNGMNDRNFDNVGRDNMQQALMRPNHEFARQMSLLMRNRPPPNQLNVDVSFLHENGPFGLGVAALLGPSPPVPPPVLPSPMMDVPLLAPFYAMRNMRGVATSSSILHARLDACYEQWRQLERERKRTEARLALAYPGRAVSSSNSIPVPRLPPCPTRVDRLTVDMLREHTKVLTLMGKMETLRASVCVAQNKKPNKPEDAKITVLKRGQENVASEKDTGVDPATFDPTTWREDINNLVDIAPHTEVESAMMSWRGAVCAVQAARRRELAPRDPRDPRDPRHRHRPDPILQLADAVRHLGACARRARAAMWSDLTLTVALAQHHASTAATSTGSTNAVANTAATSDSGKASGDSENVQKTSPQAPAIQATPEANANSSAQNSKQTTSDAKEEKPQAVTKPEPKPDNKPANKQTDKDKNQRRTQYRKVNGRNDFYQKNQRYDNRFMHNRHPYQYLATGPIN